jgi:hypothetical protein
MEGRTADRTAGRTAKGTADRRAGGTADGREVRTEGGTAGGIPVRKQQELRVQDRKQAGHKVGVPSTNVIVHVA